jgi:hypothetical protein
MFAYRKNDTMKLLGKQNYAGRVESTTCEELRDILRGHDCCEKVVESDFMLRIMLDTYMLGFIYGMRHERRRRR